MRTETNPDRYHRATVDVCYDGPMSFANAPGGGMNARFAWLAHGAPLWSETQDIIVYPGCNRMTIDLATTPAVAVNDENTAYKGGWRGQRFYHLRFDPNEDPGYRNIEIRDIKLADDAAFSTSYPITFADNAGAPGVTADIFVSTIAGNFQGTRIANDVPVAGGVNTFNWNGNNEAGVPLPNATYWVYIVMRNGSGTGTAHASGPLRLERPVAPTPSYFVPLTPARLLDTRTGEGGNLSPLDQQVFTELDVTGVGGVPETGVTAVVMNVTADAPTDSGFITAWPSGEPRPEVVEPQLRARPDGAQPGDRQDRRQRQGQRVQLERLDQRDRRRRRLLHRPTATRRWPVHAADAVATARHPQRHGPRRRRRPRSAPGSRSISMSRASAACPPQVSRRSRSTSRSTSRPVAGFITTWPTGEPRPNASTHNFVPGLTVANLVLAKVGAGGQVSMFNSRRRRRIWWPTSSATTRRQGGAFVPVAPQRLVDTRDGRGGRTGQLGQGESFDVTLANGSPVPPSASGVIVNVTAADSSIPSYVTVWPTGVQRPTASTLNPRPGVPVPNQAYLKLGNGGSLDVYNNSGSTDIIVDVFGYIV